MRVLLRVKRAGERGVVDILHRENHFLLYETISFTELGNYFGFQRLCISHLSDSWNRNKYKSDKL